MSIAVKIRVDATRCQGHSRCFALAPELFEVDDLGTAKEGDGGNVPTDLTDKARLAAVNCPEHAVIIED